MNPGRLTEPKGMKDNTVIKQEPKEIVEHKVVIYPSLTSPVEGKQVYFLFSLYQIEDIQGNMSVKTVPFSVPFVEGITVWRDTALPVVSLEHYLGLPRMEPGTRGRYMVLRSSLKTEVDIAETRIVILADREMRMMPLPEQCTRVASNGWMDHALVKGVFEWEKGFLVVPETEPIFQGSIYSPI